MVGQVKSKYILELVKQLLPILNKHHQLVFWKDEEHRYLGCNQLYAQYLGLLDPEEIVGYTDKELNPLYAQLYLADDVKVLQGEPININNPALFKELGIVELSGTMLPISHEEVHIAIIGSTSIEYRLSNKTLDQALCLINPLHLEMLVNKHSYLISSKYGQVKLSKREVQCILCLLKSYPISEISRILELSVKTVESYIAHIKNKLSVRHKHEIIDKVLEGGLLKHL